MTDIPTWAKEDLNIPYPKWVSVRSTEHGDQVNGTFMPSLKVRTLDVGQTDYYHFKFDEPSGWAIFNINDKTGEFSIQSDWGNWAHRWSINNLGEVCLEHDKPLTFFLADKAHCSYIVRKLSYCREDDKELDGNKTFKGLKEVIIEARRSGELSTNKAREMWDKLERVDFLNIDCFLQSMDYYFIDDDLFDMPHEYIYMKQTAHFNILEYKLLPFFFEYLKREVL